MSRAPWAPEGGLSFNWGADPERGERGFTWCSLCGEDTPIGVVVNSNPPDLKGAAYFCRDCCEKLAAAAKPS